MILNCNLLFLLRVPRTGIEPVTVGLRELPATPTLDQKNKPVGYRREDTANFDSIVNGLNYYKTDTYKNIKMKRARS
ncbi:MAG: hypothetical protein K9M80_08520 [Candidatus Marinimicrobia bacterium]|nr:hypothetical protein [Candidatus Neomarinimicrobiota bacterium]